MHDDRDSIERLRDRLYSRQGKVGIKERGTLHAETDGTVHSWPKEEGSGEATEARAPEKRGSRTLLTVLLGSAIFFAGSIAIALFIFLGGGNIVSSGNISLEIVGPSLVDGGKDATFQILIVNRNPTPLELADLIIEYPEGTRSAENVESPLPRVRESLGTIAAGAEVKRTATAVLFGEEGSRQTIAATLEYRVEGSNAIFVKEGSTDVTIGSAPVSITVEGPDEAVSGKEIEFTVNIVSNATADVKDVLLEAQYPFGFSVTAAAPETAVSDNLWQLGDMKPKERVTVRVRGTIEGQDNEERVFRFAVGSQAGETEVSLRTPFLTVPHTITLSKPFVSGTLTLAGKTDRTVAVPNGSPVRGVISWQNNLDTEVYDLEISAVLQGQAFDRNSVIATRGFYRSVDGTLIWSGAEDATLSNIAPGAFGEVEFIFTPTNTAGGSVIKNPEVAINVNIRAKRIAEGNVPQTVSSVIEKRVTVASPVVLTANATHFTGPFQNGGPMPPTADTETFYTVIWSVRNPSNTVAGTRVVATLPPSTRYTGSMTPTSERLSYNTANNTLTWDLGELKAGAGFDSAARTVSFQVGFTPSVSQVNSVPQIIGRSQLSGEDRFAQTRVDAEAQAVTTRLSEAQFQSGMEVVKPRP